MVLSLYLFQNTVVYPDIPPSRPHGARSFGEREFPNKTHKQDLLGLSRNSLGIRLCINRFLAPIRSRTILPNCLMCTICFTVCAEFCLINSPGRSKCPGWGGNLGSNQLQDGCTSTSTSASGPEAWAGVPVALRLRLRLSSPLPKDLSASQPANQPIYFSCTSTSTWGQGNGVRHWAGGLQFRLRPRFPSFWGVRGGGVKLRLSASVSALQGKTGVGVGDLHFDFDFPLLRSGANSPGGFLPTNQPSYFSCTSTSTLISPWARNFRRSFMQFYCAFCGKLMPREPDM